jgi:hypothetical protein
MKAAGVIVYKSTTLPENLITVKEHMLLKFAIFVQQPFLSLILISLSFALFHS